MMGDNLKMWVYGHTHYNADINVNGTRVVSNQVGYKTETTYFDANKVFEI
jgi:hypothetical protein